MEIEDLQSKSEAHIRALVNDAYLRLVSLHSPHVIEKRHLAIKARQTLLNPQKRLEHIYGLHIKQ